MNIVYFRDADTDEVILINKNDWKFEVGQVFNGFWGCVSTVTKVELDMRMDSHWENNHEVNDLNVIQSVWFKRVPIVY